MPTKLVGLIALTGCLTKPGSPGDCDHWGPFGTESAADGANQANTSEDAPWLSPDLTELWFASDRAGAAHVGHNLWHSTRATPLDAWDTPTVFDGDDMDRGDPFIDRDGLTLWFERGVFGGATRLFTAHRDSPTSPFGNPEDSGLDGIGPALSENGLVLVLSDHGGPTDNNYGIWRATRSSPDLPFGELLPLADVDLVGTNTLSPSLGDHDRTLVFYRQGGTRDTIFAATLGDDGLYHDPMPLLMQDDRYNYGDPQLSIDGSTLAYTRSTDAGNFDVFYVRRECRD